MSEDNVSVGGAERASESDSRHPADGDPYTTAHTPTNKQRDILRHALGFGRRTRPGWRNHFVTGPGSDDYADCEALVAAGLMTKRNAGPLWVAHGCGSGCQVWEQLEAPNTELTGRRGG